MNDTLKVAGRIGAELVAAKAECERLRGLLEEAADDIRDSFKFSDLSHADLELLARIDAALSQQADPAETTEAYTAVDMATAAAQGFRDGQAAVEPAAAQDEQQPTAVPEGWLIELGFDVLDRPFRFVDSKSHTPTIKVILPACEPDDSSSWDSRDEIARRIGSVLAAPIAQTAPQGKFRMGDLVKKSTGSEWVGRVVGWYSTEQTKEGYAVESSAHRNSVQIYPVTALEAVE